MLSSFAARYIRPIGPFLKDRLNHRTVQMMLVASFLQSIITMALELKVLQINIDQTNKLDIVTELNFKIFNLNCVDQVADVTERVRLIAWENRVFTLFQAWQILMVFSAVLNQNTIHIIALTCTNFAVAIYSIVQTVESVILHKRVTDALQAGTCVNYEDLTSAHQLYSFQIPMSVLNFVFALVIAYISYKLYRLFGWSVYKTIGASQEMRTIYKDFLVFCTLLQLDLFFMIAHAGVYIHIQLILQQLTVVSPGSFEILHIIITALIGPWLLFGWYSAYKESKILMGIYMVLGVGLLFEQVLILTYVAQVAQFGSWYFFIFLTVISVLLNILTWLWAIFAWRNFGQGLAPLLQHQSVSSMDNATDEKVSDLESLRANVGVIGQSQLDTDPEKPKRWAIDDDE